MKNIFVQKVEDMFMATNYMPSADSDFLTWAKNFSTYLTAHAVAMGFTAGDATNIDDVVDGFDAAMSQHVTKRDAALAARQQKDADKGSAVDEIRAMARRIQASPQVTDEDRQALGLPVRDGIRSMAVEPDMRRPYGIVDTSDPFRHTLKYREEGAAGRGRPEYAIGCEVWMKILPAGEPVPTNPDDLAYAGTNSASPYVCEFSGSDASKVAHYRLRWVSRGGAKGPWSEVISATIVG